MKKRILTLSLVIALIATCFAGTLAYLQDDDYAKNVMTLGNVKIEQLELQREEGVTYNNGGKVAAEGDLVPFVQNQMLAPTTYSAISDYTAKQTDLFYWGSYVTGEGACNGLWDDNLTGAMDKMVFVKNTGKLDCYYRTIIALECPEGTDYSAGSNKEFMVNINGNSRFVQSDEVYVTINGTRYMVFTMTYTPTLAKDEISRPSLLQVVMTHNATNEDIALLGDTYEILTLSQACQTNGFTGAENALNTVYGELTEANYVEWLKTVA